MAGYIKPENSFNSQKPKKIEDFDFADKDDFDKKAVTLMKDFSALLDDFSTLDEKRKSLWKQIYENAVTDRNNAYMLFGDLCKSIFNKPHEHAIHGTTLSKYLERMEKSNAQIIKLAELIDDLTVEEEELVFNENSMYEHIDNAKRKK